MQFSTILASVSLVAAVMAHPQGQALKKIHQERATSVTVNSDTGSVSVEVPADTTAGGPDIGGKADAVSAIAEVINKTVQLVQKMVDNDIKKRQAFTQNTAARSRDATGKNIIVSNVGYKLVSSNSDVVGTSYNAKVGSDVTFDVIAFGTGSFTLQGDGGYENWAYAVDSTCKINGKSITC